MLDRVSEGTMLLALTDRGSESPIQHIRYEDAYEPGFEDMYRRVPSLEKLERLTSFRPSMPLTDIIDRVVAYFREKRPDVAAATVGATGAA